MSYILEALKKAQAERQLGNAPTIHAPQPAALPEAAAGGRPKAWLAGLGGGALVAVAGALFLWHRGQPDPRPAPPSVPPTAAPAPAPARVAPPADTLAVSAPPETEPERPLPEPVRTAPRPAGDAGRVAAVDPVKKKEAPAAAGAPAAGAPAAGAPAAQAGTSPQPHMPPQQQVQPQPQPHQSPEDSLPFLQQLSPALQQQVPRVAFGGYMYSSNPADRLLLVDKTLRHEGEEVAPGLVLEKLLPKSAVMNFRGVRYRVAY